MPKLPPPPVYGSPEWQLERSKMVGTPEWYASNGYATPEESLKFLTDDKLRELEEFKKGSPTASDLAKEQARVNSDIANLTSFYNDKDPANQRRMLGGGVRFQLNDKGEKEFFRGPGQYGVTELAGQPLTTAQKQAQNANYNPLYDPRSAEYKAGLENLNKPKEKIAMPYTLQQQYGEDKSLPGTAAWKLAHPSFISGGTYAPGTSSPPTVTNPNPPIQPSTATAGQAPTGGFQGNLSQGYGGQMRSYSSSNPIIPTLQPPLGNPQTGQGGGGGQTKIELPDIFKMNSAIAGPTTIPPLGIRGGITMPAVTPGVKPQTFPSMNWSDMLTVAHSR